MGEHWHSLRTEEVLERLGSTPEGLSPAEARARLAKHGPNELAQIRPISPVRIFLSQFLDVLVIVLIVAAVISALIATYRGTMEEWYDTLVILIIVVFNATFGFFQEYRAEKAIQALRALAAPQAHVLRDGHATEIPSREVVPGDVVLLTAGDRIPADLRLLELASLRVNEAPLTGESVAASKSPESLEAKTGLADRRNMCFAGCAVEVGRGMGVVVATGMATELGKIAGLVQAQEPEQTPLQRQLHRLGRTLGLAILGICAIVFAVEFVRTGDALGMFLTAVSLAVAAIPEGLPAVVTITLAIGLQRMARRQALIRKLPAVEALGSATIICSDKTGTLTLGQMNAREVLMCGAEYAAHGAGFSPEGQILRDGKPVNAAALPGLEKLLTCGALCSDATVRKADGGWKVEGDSTEGALVVLAMRGGFRKEALEEVFPRIAEVPFTSERKMMTTVHASVGVAEAARLRSLPEAGREEALSSITGAVTFAKGAPEVLVEHCTQVFGDEGPRPFRAREIEDLRAANKDMALRGLRVLALAYRDLPPGYWNLDPSILERDFTFLGLVGMMDAPREDAIAAIGKCRAAGIEVVMITGDQKLTALAVAKEMDILESSELAVTGEELEAMDPAAFERDVERIRLYARVNPEHKLRIVEALRKKGHVVAMTGDGVNDAPALKKADLGIAMGITGTDVAKESADMILTDDNFASIVHAVEEGRVVYDNIRKFVRYMLSTNSGEVLVIFTAALLGWPLPLIPIQILWVNLITDGFPALALGVEPEERGAMARKPRSPKESIFARGMTLQILWVGVLMVIGTLGLYAITRSETGDLNAARTMAFLTLSLFQVANVLAVRVERESVFKAGFFRNRYLIGAVLLTVALQLLVIYVAPLAAVFNTVPLSLEQVLLAAAVASSVFFAVEIEKAIRRRRTRAEREPVSGGSAA